MEDSKRLRKSTLILDNDINVILTRYNNRLIFIISKFGPIIGKTQLIALLSIFFLALPVYIKLTILIKMTSVEIVFM